MSSQPDNKPAPPAAAAGPDVHHQRFSVPFEYPVHFTRGLFGPDNPLLADVLDRLLERRRHRAVVYIDSGVAAAHGGLMDRIKEYFHARPDRLELAGPPQVIAGGEGAKLGWDGVRDLIWTLGNLHLDRQSFVLAVGGGSVLDMVGFATSIVHRGLRLVRAPTTTLAQCDAGVGVKNGMDEHGAKNFVGTFSPPFAVLNDFDFLATLSDCHWLGGVAEAFKVALIADAALLEFLRANARALGGRDSPVMETLIRRTARIHLDHIANSGDPFEFGSARPLDFGHWAAHKLESLSGYRLPHGQAVAVGIALDCCYAHRQGLLTAGELERILAAMTACGLVLYATELEQRGPDGSLAVLDGLDQFREHLGGLLTVTLPDGIGKKVEVHQMNAGDVEAAVAHLHRLSGAPQG